MSTPPTRSEHLVGFDRHAAFQNDFLPTLQLPPEGTFRDSQLHRPPWIELPRPFVFLQTISQAKASVLEGLPEDAHPVVQVGEAAMRIRPFHNLKGKVEDEAECFPYSFEKGCYARGAEDGEWPGVVHLGAKHEEPRDAKTMIGVEMGYGEQPETAKTKLSPFPAELRPFARIKNVDPPVEPHCQ